MILDLAETLANASARRGGPLFYLDTNILVDIVRPKRRPPSLEFLNECQERSWECVASTFAFMEALDVQQQEKWARTEMRRGQFFDQLLYKRKDRKLTPRQFKRVYAEIVRELEGKVELFTPKEEFWEDSIRIAIDSTSSAPDCIHVAAARAHECDVLVTWDDALKHTAAGEIPVATPGEILSWTRTAI